MTSSIGTSKISVLITDDNDGNREQVKGIIKDLLGETVKIDMAANGKESVEWVRIKIAETAQSYDLIIMDFLMPALNGQDATTEIRELEKKQLSPSAKQSYIVTWSTAKTKPYIGADDIIAKPIDKDELKKLLDRMP